MQPLDDYTQKVDRSAARGMVYPYELVPLLAGADGTFVEHDLDDDGRLVPVDRPPGRTRPASSSAWSPRRPSATRRA